VSIESQQDQQKKKMGRPLKYGEGFRKTVLERLKGCRYILARLYQAEAFGRTSVYVMPEPVRSEVNVK
jgi:hypothetical protein